jgi:hypothetical protein
MHDRAGFRHGREAARWPYLWLVGIAACTTPSGVAATRPDAQHDQPLTTVAREAVAALEAGGSAVHAKSTPPETDIHASAPPAVAPAKLQIGAVDHHVWIMPRPSREGLALGNVRIGTAVTLKSEQPLMTGRCRRGWYRIVPRGFVCLNRRTTLDLDDPYYRALSELAPKPGAIWPYSYAHSRGAPMYSRIPTPTEWKRAERSLPPPGRHAKLGEWAKGHEELIDAAARIEADSEIPWFLAGGRRHVGAGLRDVRRLKWKTIPNGSMLAYARAVEMHGRVWLITPDLMVVPADRVDRKSVV